MITWAITTGKDTDALSRWVADVIWPGAGKGFGNCQGMAVIDGETLIGGAIWHNYEPEAGVVEISSGSTSKRWLNRQTLNVMFGVPFYEWNCQAIVLRVSDLDKPMHRMLTAVGFERYRIPRLRGRDEAENVFVLTDEVWRRSKFNRKELPNG